MIQNINSNYTNNKILYDNNFKIIVFENKVLLVKNMISGVNIIEVEIYNREYNIWSQSNRIQISDTNDVFTFPRNTNTAISVLIPEAASTDIELTVSLLHDETIDHVFEVLVQISHVPNYIITNLCWPVLS